MLLRSGYRPVGMVMGNCVYHVAHRGIRQSMRNSGRMWSSCNTPRRSMTLANWPWSGCRRRRRATGRQGIVGVNLHESSHAWGSHVIEFFAVGTAVVPNEHAEPGQNLPDITPVLDIND